MPCTVFGSHFSFTSEEASECRKLWKPKRTRSSSLMTPALIAAGRRYFCTMIEADNGFLPFRRKLGKTKSSSFAYGVLSLHAIKKPASTGCIGTGAFEAFDLGTLNWAQTYARLTSMT